MTPDLETIWSGAHNGTNDDLLCCPFLSGSWRPRIAPHVWEGERLPDAPITPGRGSYAACQAVLEHGPATAYELHLVTGFSEIQIRGAVFRMLARGVIRGEWIPKAQRSKAKTWKKYRLIEKNVK